MKKHLQQFLQSILADFGIAGIVPEVEIPENPLHGEYTTNVAMKLAKVLRKPPMEIVREIKKAISLKQPHPNKSKPSQIVSVLSDVSDVLSAIDRVDVAPPGFINFFLTDASLSTSLASVLDQKEAYGTTPSNPPNPSNPSLPSSQKIMVEFAHPNTHKAFHIGHVRNITTGESVVRLLSASGNTVIRANYQGDVGMHIAKCLYALLRISDFRDRISDMKKKDIKTKVEFLGKAYAVGSAAFDEDDKVKKEIGEINKKIYAKDPSVYPVYEVSRQWSLDYFEAIYQRLGSRFDRYYFESEVYESGKKCVYDGLEKGIFEKSEGAIIFPGEKFGLHNRVFLSGEGNTTYEGKDMGLGQLQFAEYHPDKIIHVVGPEQTGYFQVVFEALARLFPETRGKEYHLVYGWVRLKQGKMSSRSGNVVLGEWLLDSLKQKINNILDKNDSYPQSENDKIAEAAAVAAVKYSFLRVGTTQEFAFDLEESISFEGDSGPYLLYTYARCRSVLRKAHIDPMSPIGLISPISSFNPEERALARAIMHFPDIVAGAAEHLAPSSLCTYLNRLASAFNLFYAKHPILGDPKRLALTAATAQVLKNGLHLLGITAVERM